MLRFILAVSTADGETGGCPKELSVQGGSKGDVDLEAPSKGISRFRQCSHGSSCRCSIQQRFQRVLQCSPGCDNPTSFPPSFCHTQRIIERVQQRIVPALSCSTARERRGCGSSVQTYRLHATLPEQAPRVANRTAHSNSACPLYLPKCAGNTICNATASDCALLLVLFQSLHDRGVVFHAQLRVTSRRQDEHSKRRQRNEDVTAEHAMRSWGGRSPV